MTMKKQVVMAVTAACALAFCGGIALAQTESPAKAAARKKAEQKLKDADPSASSGASHAPLDLNKATKQQLMGLPGIGASEADSIIAARPYLTKTQLRKKDIIPAETFYDILDRVTVDIIIKKQDEKPVPEPAAKGANKGKKKSSADRQ